MANRLPRSSEIIHCGKFKKAMWRLCTNKHITFEQAEKALGFKDGFIECVEKGVHELTLKEVQKIANYFHTTMDSVLDGGNTECRIHLRAGDELGVRQEEECLEAYSCLLNDLAMDHWKQGLFVEEVREKKLRLERCQRAFIEHFKAHMDEEDAKDRAKEMAKCEDDMLIKELLSRGYKVEKDGKWDGKYNSKNQF